MVGSAGYGWLGAKERSTTVESAGLTLIGDRLYNSVTGRFTSLDPEPGGNPTAYTYPTDPINNSDLSGRRPDDGGRVSKPSYMNSREWKAYNQVKNGEKVTSKADYKSAMKKRVKYEKEITGQRNAAKRNNRLRKGGRGGRLGRTLGWSPFWMVVTESWRQGPWFRHVDTRNMWA